MKAIEFVVEGAAVPQGRPRAVRTTNGVRMYDSAESVSWKQYFRLAACQFRPDKPLEGPVHLRISFHLPRPKSRPKKNFWPDKKPDLDNLAKAVMDAMTGVFWLDDSQICNLDLHKYYCGVSAPYVFVKVWSEDTHAGTSAAEPSVAEKDIEVDKDAE